jgi:hypothetical protein
LHLQIKIILNWLMDARSSKQSAAALINKWTSGANRDLAQPNVSRQTLL